jgi:hypothetical protein
MNRDVTDLTMPAYGTYLSYWAPGKYANPAVMSADPVNSPAMNTRIGLRSSSSRYRDSAYAPIARISSIAAIMSPIITLVSHCAVIYSTLVLVFPHIEQRSDTTLPILSYSIQL